MKKEPTKRPIKSGRWELDYGLDVSGKKLRRTYKTEDDADTAIDEYRTEVKKRGEFWARLAPVERDLLVGILQDIKAKGQTLQGVWADWQRWQKDNQQTTTTPMPYADVIAEFKHRKLGAGKTQRYVDEVADLFSRFGKGREKQPIHEIQPSELETWINAQKSPNGETWSLSTKRTNQGRFSSLWEVAKAKGWCSLNIVDRLEPVTNIGVKVEIYSNETTLHIMAAALSSSVTQQILAPLALGFFGCMRPEEVESVKAIQAGKPVFGWDNIDLKHGLATVSVDVAKTGDQRTIRLQPIAVEWLKLAKELKNPLPPVNERRLVDQCCEMIGLKVWIRDGLRKNCATHLRAIYKNDYDVVKDMGNSIRVLLKHYADLHVPESVSLEHWEISPNKVRAYIKSKTWRDVVTAASATRPAPSANETAKSVS
ncbi:MAG: hypothetical protein ABSC18_08975 [Verrucomicrobiota bacterium]|jgi:hypothetical protein